MTGAPDVVFKPREVRTRQGRTLKVREYAFEEFGALIEMYKGFGPKRVAQGLPPRDVPRIAHWLDGLQHKGRGILALDGARVVGHAILCPVSDAASEFTIFVHQNVRRQRLGTELSRLTIHLATRTGFAEIFPTTELHNFPAACLYRKVGFEATSACGEECEMRLATANASRVQGRAA